MLIAMLTILTIVLGTLVAAEFVRAQLRRQLVETSRPPLPRPNRLT